MASKYPQNKPFEKYQLRQFTVECGWVYEANMSLAEFDEKQEIMSKEKAIYDKERYKIIS